MNENLGSFPLFAKEQLKTYNLEGLGITTSKALNFLEKEIQEEFEELNLKEVQKQRQGLFKIGQAQDYQEKIVSLSNGQKILCGIRHEGCDPEKPFVQLTPSFELRSPKEALKVYEEIRDQFSIFRPKFIRYWSAFKDERVNLVGSIFMVAPTQKIKKIPPWQEESRIELQAITDPSYYSWYLKHYKEFHQERPDLKTMVGITPESTLKESLDQGLLFFALIKGERIGLIAAVRSPFLGLSGFYFNEILLSQKWKGKGLAKALQRKFIQEHAQEEIVWGTIDHSNLTSLGTARANGRVGIRYECFLKI